MKNETTVAVPTLEQTVQRMKSEVLADVARGQVPNSVASFGDLHDYVDANEYGGFCEDELADAMIAHFGGRDADEGMPDAFITFMNDAQTAIDTWIKEGGVA